MPGDDLFKRYLEVGASILGMTRERAEGIVKDLVASGEVAKGQAGKAADRLVERGRTGTEELAELVRREIRQQVTALGCGGSLATKDDLVSLEARLEARIDELEKAAKLSPRPRKAKTSESAPTAKSAGISRSGSVRTRAGAAPPTGGAEPTKG